MRRWRDAALLDLAAPEMRPLMGLRMRPRSTAHHVEVERASATPRTERRPLRAEIWCRYRILMLLPRRQGNIVPYSRPERQSGSDTLVEHVC